jgi:mono/diheme cytochrome c family protein
VEGGLNHPVWEVELGSGLLIALVAIAHVASAQLAVGTAVLLPLLEARARRASDEVLLSWVRRHAGFLAEGVRMVSTLSGASLWIVLAVAAPAATEALCRSLFFPLGLAFLAGLVSLSAGLAYARGFDRLDPPTHLATGWLGAAAAVLSLVASDAVVERMLDPSVTFDAPGLLAAFGTPLLFPSAMLRLSAAAGLAGLAVLATAGREAPELKVRLARLGALTALPGALVGPASAWLCLQVVGPSQRELLEGEVRAAALGFQVAIWAAVLGAAALAAVAVLSPRRPSLVGWPVAALLVGLGASASAGGEYLREAVRRPWAFGSGAHGAMYASGLTPDEVRRARTEGLLAQARFSAARRSTLDLGADARGEEVFRIACRACHTVAGVGSIRRVVDGLPRQAIAVAVARLGALRGRMPPFPGSPADAADLVTYLAGLDGVLESPPPPLPPGDLVDAGRRVFEYRCLGCHRDVPVRARVAGWTADFAYEAIGRLPKLKSAMPAFGGDDDERKALAAYLTALGAGQAP